MDTAAVLLIGRAGTVVLDDLRGAADAAAGLAATHRDTPMIARTLGQQALPTTFGLVAAGWCTGLDRAGVGLARALTALPVQLGGAAGTLAALHPHGPAVAASLARAAGAGRRRAVARGAHPDRRARRRARRRRRGLCQARHRHRAARRHRAGRGVARVRRATPRPCRTSATRSRRPPRGPPRGGPSGPRRCCSAPPTTSTSARRERGTPSGRPWATCCAAPEAPRPGCGPPSTACGCTPTGWPRTSPSAVEPVDSSGHAGELVDRLLRERTLTG